MKARSVWSAGSLLPLWHASDPPQNPHSPFVVPRRNSAFSTRPICHIKPMDDYSFNIDQLKLEYDF